MTEEAQSKFESLQRKYDSLVSDANLSLINSRVSDITAKIADLPTKIKELRDRGYAYRSYLENKSEVFQQQWDEIRTRVHNSIERAVADLGSALNRPKPLLTNLERQVENENMFERMAEQAEQAIDDLEQKVNSAVESIESIFSTLEDDLRSTYQQISDIEWVLDMKESATFEFGAAEDVFLAAKAELVLTGKGRKDPDGILFLTNQRIVFEQREKTGKKLGMFGGKMEQEVEWETLLSAVDGMEVENKGMFGGKDMIHFNLNAGDMRRVTLEVKGGADNKFWQKQVTRMISGDTEDERAIEPDPEMIEALKNAPTACHVCGATLPQIVAGQTEISCQYCGTVVRVM